MTSGSAMTMDSADARREISEALGVPSDWEVESDTRARVAFIERTLRDSSLSTLVLGISGGVDSLTAGLLCARASRNLRESGYDAQFLAIRLPYGEQLDSQDAEDALQFIVPDETLRIDIKPAVDSTMQGLRLGGFSIDDAAKADYVSGNVRARQRMIVQYACANASNGLVVGTDHAAEALMGFFTKHGDGACDLTPLAGLTKRRGRAIARSLGAPEYLVEKTPTADLEAMRPLRADEEALGVTYGAIDDFLEGLPVARADADRIIATYRATAHKRGLPAAP